MFTFIKRHWVAYLVGALIALALGFGVAYAVGVIGSTPEATRIEQTEAEQEDAETSEDASAETDASSAS